MKMTVAEPAGNMIPNWKALLATWCLLLVLQAGPALGSRACHRLPQCSCHDRSGYIVDCRNKSFTAVPDASHLNPVRLILDENIIQTLTGASFTGLSSLKELSLNGNNISLMTVDVFKHVANLTMLNLANNHISKLADSAFASLHHLRVLNLRGNTIRTLNRHSFAGLTNLKDLYLSNNSISHLNAGIFTPVANLRKLELSRNLITRLSGRVFNGLTKLSILNLRHNKLHAVPAHAFYGVKADDIIISHNPRLREIADNAFNGATIRYLNITMNPSLSSFHPRAFSGSSIQTIDLRNNSLSEMNPYVLDHMPKLRQFLISGNNWNVSRSVCALQRVRDWTLALAGSSDITQTSIWMLELTDEGVKKRDNTCPSSVVCYVSPSGHQRIVCDCEKVGLPYHSRYCVNFTSSCHTRHHVSTCCPNGTSFGGFGCSSVAATPTMQPSATQVTQSLTSPITQAPMTQASSTQESSEERISRTALARLESEVKKLGDDQAEIWKEMSSLEHYVEGMLKKVMAHQADHVMRVLDENEERQFMLEERLSALKENHSESFQDHHARIQSHINTLKLNISALHNKLHKNQHHKSDVMDTSQGNSTTSSMPSAIWLFDPLNKAADVEVAPDGRIARSMTGAGGAVIGRNGYLTGKHQWIIRVHGIGHSVWLGVTHVPKPHSHTFFDSKNFYGWSNHKECARATSDVSIFPGAMKWHNNQLLRLTLDLSQQRLLLRHEGHSVEHSISLGHRGEPLYLYSYMGYGWNVEIVKYTMLSML